MMVKIGAAAIALLILGFQPGLGLAQSDDEDAPTPAPASPAPKSSDQLFHRHGAGGDDDPPRGLLRGNPTANDGMRLESIGGTGLAMDHSPLPGELGDTPEATRPLFAKPSTSLAIQPDPWAPRLK